MLERGYALNTLQRELTGGEIRFDRASIDGVLLGFSSHAPYCVGHALMLQKLYVDAAHRGRGCARELVESAAQRARDGGMRCMILRVNKRNRIAIAAYERLGFSIAGPILSEIGQGFWMDDHLMRRDV